MATPAAETILLQSGHVLVTTHRLVIPPHTYAVRQIVSVRQGPPIREFTTLQALLFVPAVILLLCVCLASANFLIEGQVGPALIQTIPASLCGLAIWGAVRLGAFRRWWPVAFALTHDPEEHAQAFRDPEQARQLADAIRQAIVARD